MGQIRKIPVICMLSRECAADLAEIERESNSPPWTQSLFSSEFENRYSTVYGVRVEGRLVAFLVSHVVLDEAHIVNFGVRAAFRGRGIGKTLLRHVLRELYEQSIIKVTLEVRRSNSVARAIYESLGFSEAAVRSQYYTDNQEDAVVMSLDIRHFVDSFGRQEVEFDVCRAGLPAAGNG